MSHHLLPVYPAEQVADLMRLRIPNAVLDRFSTAPEPSSRRIIVWHPGLSLMEQAELPLVTDRGLLWVAAHL